MRAALVSLIAVWFFTPLCGMASDLSVASPSDSIRAEDGGEEAPAVPKWRLAVRAFPDGYSEPVLGIYRRVGGRYEFGLAVDGDLNLINSDSHHVFQDSTGTHVSDSDAVLSRFSVTIHGELRRWSRISDDLSWYVGTRVGTGYSDSYEGDSYERTTHSLILSSVAGGDLQLLKHLSVSASFQPISLSYSWWESRDDWSYGCSDGSTECRSSKSTDHDRILTIDISPYATAYLNLKF